MLPHFRPVRNQDVADAIVGNLFGLSSRTETWVADGGSGYLLSHQVPHPVIIPGDWRSVGDLWAFTPESDTPLADLQSRMEWTVLDDYWGERAALVLDPARKWHRTEFAPVDAVRVAGPAGETMITRADPGALHGTLVKGGWDHEHCAICWGTIGIHGGAVGYVSPPDIWACEDCHRNFISTRSLDFIKSE